MNNIEVRIVSKADRKEVFDLYLEGGWWEESDRAYIKEIDRVISGSFAFAAAFENDRMIGMGRAISDGVSDAYIQDVVVYSAYRGQGIGKLIVEALVSHLKDHSIGWIGLIANPGTAPFYEKIGFSEMKEFTPMVLKGTENV